MKSLLFASLLFSSLFLLALSQNLVTEIVMSVSYNPDRQCDMVGATGSISVKVCGEDCCFKSHIGGSYVEDSDYTFAGSGLGECDLYNIGNLNEGEVNMGLYHGGTDSVCFDSVTVKTLSGQYAACNFTGAQLDDEEYLISNACIVNN